MWDVGTYLNVLGVVVFCGFLEKYACEGKNPEEFTPCPFNFKPNGHGNCEPEPEHQSEYTEYYIWIGIISGLVVLLGVALLSCVCCKCCLIYRRRVALENARARNNEAVSSISSLPQIGHGAHGPVSHQFRFPVNPSLPRIDNGQHQMSSFTTAEGAGEQYLSAPFHRRQYEGSDPRLPMYSQLPIPVFPDEPPPRYTP